MHPTYPHPTFMVDSVPVEEPRFEVDLGVLAGDPDAERAVTEFVDSLRRNRHTNNGFGNRFNIVLSLGQKDEEVPMQQTATPKSVANGTPRRLYDGDWYDNEDQMSRGGDGSGGNWID